jgi:hypothetical protein
MLAIENTIRGLLKVHGLKLGTVHRSGFAAKVETLLADAADLRMAIEPLLEARNMMRKQKALFDRRLGQMAQSRRGGAIIWAPERWDLERRQPSPKERADAVRQTRFRNLVW